MASRSGSSSRSKVAKANPVMRKLAQHERQSIDLDRPATEQSLGMYVPEYGNGPRSAHEVNFNQTAKRGYHNRSTSGTSQFSTATSGSGQRNGSFVHPFQQMPRPYTPPAAGSYHGSLMGSDRDSNNLAEIEDTYTPHMRSSASNLSSCANVENNRRPSKLPTLHIQTRSDSASRLTKGNSQTNLHSARSILSSDLTSPTDTISPVSAVRTSLDMGFRIRSRSEAGPQVRRESIQEARRKFHEKEQAKAEKVAQQEIRELEKRNQKEARRAEKGARHSITSDETRSKRSKSDLTITQEKGDVFIGRDYSTAAPQAAPNTGDYNFQPPKRNRTSSATKKKTHSAWTTFMMWFRTRLLRMSHPGRS